MSGVGAFFGGLYDSADCPIVETGGQGAPCLRESPLDRYSLIPLAAGLGVGALGGGGLALSALLIVVSYVEKNVIITIPGQAAAACPVQQSTASALCDLLMASIGWELGSRLQG